MYHYLFLTNVRIHELKRNNVRIIEVTYNGGMDNRGSIVYNKNTIYTIMWQIVAIIDMYISMQ